MHHNGLFIENNNLKDDFILKCQMHTNACIYALCMLGGARFLHALILHLEHGHFESCLKTIGGWGQKLWTIPISFGGGFEPSP